MTIFCRERKTGSIWAREETFLGLDDRAYARLRHMTSGRRLALRAHEILARFEPWVLTLRPPETVPAPTERIEITLEGSFFVTVYDEWIALPGEAALLFVPALFRFDMASVPRLARWLISPHELGLRSTLVHDYLCVYRGLPPMTDPWARSWSSAAVHAMFGRLMEAEGIAPWRRAIASRIVRTFGPRWRVE